MTVFPKKLAIAAPHCLLKGLHISCFNRSTKTTKNTIECHLAIYVAFSVCLWNQYDIVDKMFSKVVDKTTRGLPAKSGEERANQTTLHP